MGGATINLEGDAVTNLSPEKLKVELASLMRRIARARAMLSGLQEKIAAVDNSSKLAHQSKLVEANERLVVAAMESHFATDSVMQALDAVNRSSQLDPLTRLPNRTMMHDRITQGIASAKRHNQCLAILFIDIDQFKNINDTLGHAAGDQVLKNLSARMVDSVRDVDTVSRHGGDEFLILLPEVEHTNDAELVAKKLAKATAKTMTVGKFKLKIGISIGVCVYPTDATDADALIASADRAMYKVKRARRN